jgi:hypothetical protein
MIVWFSTHRCSELLQSHKKNLIKKSHISWYGFSLCINLIQVKYFKGETKRNETLRTNVAKECIERAGGKKN